MSCQRDIVGYNLRAVSLKNEWPLFYLVFLYRKLNLSPSGTNFGNYQHKIIFVRLVIRPNVTANNDGHR